MSAFLKLCGLCNLLKIIKYVLIICILSVWTRNLICAALTEIHYANAESCLSCTNMISKSHSQPKPYFYSKWLSVAIAFRDKKRIVIVHVYREHKFILRNTDK